MADLEKLNVSLTADLVAAMQEAVASGEYASTGEVIRDALREWQERRVEHENRVAAIQRKIAAAADNPVRLSDADVTRHFDEMLAATRKQKAS